MAKNTKSSSSTAKKTAVKKTATKTNSPVVKSKSNIKLKNFNGAIFGLVIVQVLMILVLGYMISDQELSISNIENKVSGIETKVSTLDTFFTNNVPGYTDGGAAPTAQQQQAAPAKVDESVLEIEGEPTLGDANAPVTIVEFSDYECPFCAKFYRESHAKIKEEYIDTGKVKLVFKDFPLGFHELATPAAVAANCVFKELGDEKYFEMHDTIFENQQSLSKSSLKEWALELGADQSAYDTCIADPEMVAEVQDDMATGAQNGVSGTPSFFINGNLIVGAQPYSVLKAAIDAELK